MKPTTLSFSLCLALGLAPVAYAADLLDIYHEAQNQDAVFGAARAARAAGQEKLAQGRSLLLPSISFNANTFKNNQNVTYAPGLLGNYSGSYPYNSNGYGLNLVQPLFRAQNWAAYNQSELQVAISEAQFKQAEQDVILRSAQAYFDVLIAEDTVELTAAQKTAITQQLEQAKRNFEVGTATITDTYEAQARYDLIVAQELVAASDLEIKRRTLQQLVNTDVKELSPLGAGFKLEGPMPTDVQKWVADSQIGNIQVVQAQASYQLAEQEVARNRDANLPTVDLVAGYNKSNVNGSIFAADTTNSAIGVQLNIPLYEGGALSSQSREAAAKSEQARNDLDNVQRSAELQTRQAYLGVVSGIAQVQALQQALKSSESSLQASKLGQQVGVRTNIDVLNAQQQFYSTRRDLYQAQYNYLVSELRLKAAVGSLNEDDLQRVNRALH